ncbi:MAG TPA: GAF domain-containing protein, partial [Candidatus Dormibacteraeota bacterium]|nr:GAF domain-containing protein [Candidatus Dormibacteraeota bacterium]
AALLRSALDEAARLLSASGGMVYLHDPEAGDLRFALDVGVTDRRRRAWIRRLRLPFGVGMFGRAAAERSVVATDDYPADASFPHAPEADRVVDVVGIRSMVVAPLLAGDRALGAFGVFSERPAAFSAGDVALVRTLAAHAATSIANRRLIADLARAREAEARRAEVERALREIAMRISAVRDTDALLQLVVDEAARLLGADGARIDLLDPRSGGLYWAYDAMTGRRPGLGPIQGEGEAQAGEGISGRAVSERRVVRTGDYLHDERFTHASAPDDHARRHRIDSALAAPLLADDDPFGTLTVYTSGTDAFGPDDDAVLMALASQAGVAIRNARLFEALATSREESARRADSERTLREVASRIASIHEPARLLQEILDQAAALLGAERAQLDLVEPIGDFAQWTFPPDSSASRAAGGVPRFGIGGHALRSGRAVWTGDYLADRSFRHGASTDRFVREAGLRSIVAAPLATDGRLVGVIQLGTSRAAAYGPEDAALLESLATVSAVGIANVRLIAELDRSRDEVARRADAERALREISGRLATLRAPGDVLGRVLEEAVRLLGARGGVIDLLDPATGRFEWAHEAGVPPAERAEWIRRGAGEAIVRRAVADGAVVRSDDYPADKRFETEAQHRAFLRRAGVRSLVVAPLVGEGIALGTLGVFSDIPGRWGGQDAELLGVLADQAAIAVTNARLIDELGGSREELSRRVDTERALREIAARITALGEPGEVLQQIVEESRRLLDSDGAHLTLMSEDGSHVYPVVVAGGGDAADAAWMRTQRFPLEGGLNGLAAGLGEALWTRDYLVDPRIPHEADDQEVAERMALRGMAVAPLRAPEGEVVGTLAISHAQPRDIAPGELELLQGLADHAAIAVTNSRLLERVRASEARYRFLIQNAPDIVFSADRDGRIAFLSDSVERLLGHGSADLIGQPFSSLIDEASIPFAVERWAEMQAEPGRQVAARLDMRHRDGRTILFEINAVGFERDGAFAGIQGVGRDISERERLQRDLRESEARYRDLVQSSPDGVWQADAEGRFTFWSDTAASLLGWRPEAVVGHHFSRVVTDASADAATAAWGEVAAGSPLVRVRLTLRGPGGDELPAEVSAVPMFRDGGFAGAHGSVRDLRDRERLERGLRRQAAEIAASEERAHLARELHDSVTQALFSMTLVTRSIELLMARDPAAAAEKLAALRELQRDALAEMRSLIFELRPGSLEQDGLVRALRTHAAALEGRVGMPILIEADDVPRLPIAVEDATYRIAQEALHNVVKHAGAREVRLRLSVRDERLMVAIEDDGQGFDPASVPAGHVGLAGMRARAERVGGTLAISSRRGSGTRIELELPVSPPEQPLEDAVVRDAAGVGSAE